VWSYSNPGVRKELMERKFGGEQHPENDVDYAFNFLDTYTTPLETEDRDQDQDDRWKHDPRRKSYSTILSEPELETRIPRVKVPEPRSPRSQRPPSSGPGARYFVSLKN